MEALFIVPTIVSSNTSERIVPSIAKMIERNVAITNFALFRTAAIRKYMDPNKSIFDESTDIIILGGFEANKINLNESYILTEEDLDDQQQKAKNKASSTLTKADQDLKNRQKKNDNKKDDDGSYETPGFTGERDKLNTQKADEWEAPRGISFFNQVSLEPTIIEISLEQYNEKNVGNRLKKKEKGLDLGKSERVIRIGIKCIPYKVEGVTDVVKLMDKWRNSNVIGRWFRRKVIDFVKKIHNKLRLPTKVRARGRGEIIDNNIKMIKYGPNRFDLSKSRNLEKMLSPSEPSTWSTMVVLSSYDLENQNLYDLAKDYRKLVSIAWGDMIIVNESKESVFFCTQRTLTCQELSFEYLKNIMKLDNILDYTDVSRKTTPFSIKPFRTAISESSKNLIENRIEDIIK